MSPPFRVAVAVAVTGLFAVGIVRGDWTIFGFVVLVTAWAGLLGWHLVDRPNALRRRRLKCGLCGKCGYDLRGSVSGVCPECGQPR